MRVLLDSCESGGARGTLEVAGRELLITVEGPRDRIEKALKQHGDKAFSR